MRVALCYEKGYAYALFGIGLSYGLTSFTDVTKFATNIRGKVFKRLQGIAVTLSQLDGGEDKFLRQIVVCLDIVAPRYWWNEMDTYKVGTTAQSESTMHSILKHRVFRSNFEIDPDDDSLDDVIDKLNDYIGEGNFRKVIELLPQSYLQRRIWTGNYAVLKNIFAKRSGHKLKEWHFFVNEVRRALSHPELLPCKTQ